jgi:MFS family permease
MHKELLKGWRLVHLSLIVSFPAVIALVLTPALPDLALFFGLSQGAAQMTMTVYLLGYALGMLLHEPLADRVGRRRTIVMGFGATLLFTLLGLWVGRAGLFHWFCIFRALQGIAAASGIVALVMIADLREQNRTPQALFRLILLFASMLGVSVFLGGICTEYWGWGGTFGLMALYSGMQCCFAFFLPETRPSEPAPYTLGIQFTDPFLLLYGTVAGLSTALIYLFSTTAPFLADDLLVTPSLYGLLSLVPFSGLLIGLALSHFDIQMPRISLLAGIFYSLLGSIAMQVFFINEVINPLTLFIFSLLIFIAPAVIYPKAIQVVIGEATQKVAAFAVFQFLHLMIPCIVLFVVGLLPVSPTVLPLISGACAVLALFTWFALKARHVHK